MEQSLYKATKISTIIIILFVILGILNGEYLRPNFGNIYILNHILGSMPNFIGSYILYVLFFSFIQNKYIQIKNKKNIRTLMYFIGVLIFSIMTFEEYFPFFFGSKTFDIVDIIANGFGVLFAFFTINSFIYDVKY